jgi:hypothetical protein
VPAPVLATEANADIYFAEGAFGTLAISPVVDGVSHFELSAGGYTDHTCNMEGDLRKGVARVEAPDRSVCVVTFKRTDRAIAVSIKTPEACTQFCDPRVDFEPIYRKRPVGCDGHSVAATRSRFKGLYDRKAYEKAVGLLRPVLVRCDKTIDYENEMWVRNDLAVAYYKMGDKSACLSALKPMEDAREEDARPSNTSWLLPIIKAARTNLKLCGAAVQ